MNIELSPKNILKKNLYLIMFLFCANLAGLIFKHYLDHKVVYGLVPLFDFDKENNIPTLYSSIALFIASALLFLIAFMLKISKSPYFSWLVLSVIFIYLSIDETSSIHERLATPVHEILETSGFLYYAWVIPYSVALVAFVIAYSKFLSSLPKRIMILFLVSGFIYVSGAIGFEMLGGRQAELYGKNNILFSFFYTCEESLEMIGIALFIYALLVYIANQFETMIITLRK